MDTTCQDRFITRKEVSQRCQKADRTLQRYWSKAVATRDRRVLDHLKLVTEDGEEYAGVGVTKKLIDDLKRKGLVPTWFADAEWATEVYGSRLEEQQRNEGQDRSEYSSDQTTSESVQNSRSSTASSEYVELLKQQIDELKLDKAAMREQITQFTQTLQQNNTLQQELHTLLNGMQERLLPAPAPPHRRGVVVPDEVAPVTDVSTQSEQETADVIDAEPQPTIKVEPKTASKKKKTVAKNPPAKWYNMPVQELGQRMFSRRS